MEHFQQPRFRTLRAAMFAGLGLWGIVPAVHGYVLYHGIAIVKKAVAWDALMGVVYLVRSCQPWHELTRVMHSSLPTRYADSVTPGSAVLHANYSMLICFALRQVGAGLYASRVPERWAPGKFDLLWNSHNLFHLAVVTAALIHYKSVLLLLNWRDSGPNCL